MNVTTPKSIFRQLYARAFTVARIFTLVMATSVTFGS